MRSWVNKKSCVSILRKSCVFLALAGCGGSSPETSSAGNAIPSSSPTGTLPVSNSDTATTLGIVSPNGLYSFGNIAVGGTSTTENFIVQNGSLGATQCVASVDQPADFTIVSNTCSSPIGINASCTVGVQANPLAIGNLQANLSLQCTTGKSVIPLTTPIAVTGISSPGGTLAGSGYFAPTEAGIDSSTVATFTLANALSIPLTGCGAPTLSNSADFYILSNSCGSTVPAWSQCTFYIKSNPQSAGVLTSNLSLSCSQGGTFTFANPLTVTSSIPNPRWNYPTGLTLTQNLSSWTTETDFFIQNNADTASATGCHPVVTSGDVNAFTVDATSFDLQVSNANGFLGPWGEFEVVRITPNAPAPGTYHLTLSMTCDNSSVIGPQTAQTTITLTAQ